MTQDEIIEMAREAGFEIECCSLDWHKRITAFAHLVAAKEREACAKLCETKHFSSPVREFGAKECAIAIRARGEQALAQPKQDGDCKKCKDGCPACDARKLQKEAHDLP
jgi:hypothetical protein